MKTHIHHSTVIRLALAFLLFNGNCALAGHDQATAIRYELRRQTNHLYYPLTVNRFYAAQKFRLAWLAPDTVKTHAYDAMLLLDCVKQYGLNHADYHPHELVYDQLNLITTNYARVGEDEKAAFDIFLTDAIIRLINNLHYGKLNAKYPAKLLDMWLNDGLRAENILIKAVNGDKFMATVEGVQPRSDQYHDLQLQMHLLAGVYVGDCYEIPEAALRQISVNMERLRWMPVNGRSYVQINIPSSTLKLHRRDTDISIPVAIGKRETPTPMASAVLTGIAVRRQVPDASRWLPPSLNDIPSVEEHAGQVVQRENKRIDPNLGGITAKRQNPAQHQLSAADAGRGNESRIVFKMAGGAGVRLTGWGDGLKFNSAQLATSNGDIKVAKAEMLAAALLKGDGKPNSVAKLRRAMAARQQGDYRLKDRLPIYMTYLTCEVKDGMLETYDDLYHRDDRLAKALFKGATVPAPYQ